MEKIITENRQERLPLIALRGLVMFPKMVLHFDVGRSKSILALNEGMKRNHKVFLVAQKDIKDDDPTVKQMYSVGVVAEVRQVLKVPGDNVRVLVEGQYRAKILEITSETPYFEALVEEYPLHIPKVQKSAYCDALMRSAKELFQEYSYLLGKLPQEMIMNVLSSEDPVQLAEFIAGNLQLEVGDKQRVLNESVPNKRLEYLIKLLEHENSILAIEREIQEKVREGMDKNQREYFLREQMKAIANELGDGDVQEEAMEYARRIDELNLPEEIAEKLDKEAERLFKMPGNSPEATVIRTYLDTCLELPWNRFTKDRLDIVRAKKQLDKDHYGLKTVKERILELLAVRELAPDIKGQIICLVGPPGVGKTSIARSIAESMGRKYIRISLGGVRDESDIRGHRKTYIGAMPGRIMNAMKQVGSANPLMLLDEIDKMGNDFRGDPASAMLEVLDPEQNVAFRDHYLEIPFDLSHVLFITTANTLDTIPAPLLDRMEIINLSSYTREDKFQIAKKHLLSKQMKRNGLTAKTLKIADDALYALIDNYTREAGVRKLEQSIASLCRKAAKKIVSGEKKVVISGLNITDYLGPKKFHPDLIGQENEVGVVNGLAWTSVGGEMMQIEVAVLDGNGKIELTGSLGEVMKESARIAISYVRSIVNQYGIDPDFYKNKDIHIHAPEGAVPKDGPSAGVTLCTALVSALTGIPVRREVAMTGEVTLRGRVLAIGGLKEKTMAAYRAGVKTVLIPEENLPDLAEVDDVVKEAIQFVPAKRVETVLQTALLISSDLKDAGDAPVCSLHAQEKDSSVAGRLKQ